MSEFLMMPLGSAGDTFPFIGVGRALAQRGHTVSAAVNGHFRDAVAAAGIGYHEVGTDEQYKGMLRNPDLWNPYRGLRAVVRSPGTAFAMREQYRLIESALRKNPGLVVVAGSLAFGARIAEEKLGVKLVSLHLQPVIFFSVTNPPVPPNGKLPLWLPPFALRLLYHIGDEWMFGPHIGKTVEPFRRELGLPKAGKYLSRWMHSPDLEIGLFPKWFAYAKDWPPKFVLTGFPLYDDGADKPLPPDVETFLNQGGPPVVITFGTGMLLGEKLFAAAAKGVELINRRAVFLTPYREQLPPVLPANSAHFSYVSLSKLLPRAAAIIHHGGIGTTSQALRAGIPQIITPLAHDQPDNADRVEKLNAGRAVSPKKVTGQKLEAALRGVLDNAAVAASCKEVARRIEHHDAIAETCALIEAFANE